MAISGSTRRSFLLLALTAAGAAVAAAAGLTRRAGRAITIPVKMLNRKRFREPNDLAG